MHTINRLFSLDRHKLTADTVRFAGAVLPTHAWATQRGNPTHVTYSYFSWALA
jgi:hypothetical protein